MLLLKCSYSDSLTDVLRVVTCKVCFGLRLIMQLASNTKIDHCIYHQHVCNHSVVKQQIFYCTLWNPILSSILFWRHVCENMYQANDLAFLFCKQGKLGKPWEWDYIFTCLNYKSMIKLQCRVCWEASPIPSVVDWSLQQVNVLPLQERV